MQTWGRCLVLIKLLKLLEDCCEKETNESLFYELLREKADCCTERQETIMCGNSEYEDLRTATKKNFLIMKTKNGSGFLKKERNHSPNYNNNNSA